MSWKRRLVFFSCTVLSVFADPNPDPNPDPKESVSLLERSKDFYVLSQDDFEAIIDLTRPPSLQNLTLVLNISYRYIFCLNNFEFPALFTGHFSREKAREIQNMNNIRFLTYSLL